MTYGVSAVYKKAIQLDAMVYHLHDPELMSIALRLQKKGKKVIFDSHENYYEQIKTKQYINKFLWTIIARLYYMYETHVCRHIDGVIMPTTVLNRNVFENRCKRFALVNNLPRLEEFNNKKLVSKEYKSRKIFVTVAA